MSYTAPVRDILFTLNEVLDLSRLGNMHPAPDLDTEMLGAVLEEAGRFAVDILEPLNKIGDEKGSSLSKGKVKLPDGWSEAYDQWREGGWASVLGDPEYGGQGLPNFLNSAVQEMWNSANISFALAPMLSQGAAEALHAHGSDELKGVYLEKLISGEWAGTMNLTEPQAGSDLGALRCKAEPQDDGTYRLKGTKIFITYGDHEMTDNIVHLVLARLPDAPPGTRGISLFVVPKYLVNDDGSLGELNDVVCAGLEHKLGIHASPTCVMSFGEKDGAVGYLIGEENHGLSHMFTMMNNARLAVGVQGIGIAEMATQAAAAYADERKQGRAPGAPPGEMSTIIHHPDIRRSLMSMRSLTQGSRAICLATALALDMGHHERAGLLTPIAKGFSTDIAVEVASMGIQVHGGMGYIEETGAAQYFRDARILPIYEGTNGIQAIDLVARKLPMDGGNAVREYIDELRGTAEAVMSADVPGLGRTGYRLNAGIKALEEATEWMLQAMQDEPETALAGATPYLRLFGLAACGIYLARGAFNAVENEGIYGDEENERVVTARFFAENLLPETEALQRSVTQGAASVLALAPEQLA